MTNKKPAARSGQAAGHQNENRVSISPGVSRTDVGTPGLPLLQGFQKLGKTVVVETKACKHWSRVLWLQISLTTTPVYCRAVSGIPTARLGYGHVGWASFIVGRSSFVVGRSSLAVKDHLPRQMVSFCRNGMTGRHGCAGLGPPIRGRYRQAVHQAGRPACGPYGIAMGRWNFVHFAGQPACAPYGIAMDHSPLPSRSARFPISPLCHCSPFSFSFSEEPFDSVHTDWRQGIQILFRWISRGFL